MGFDIKAIPRWILAAAGVITPTNDETARVNKLEINDANSYIDEDGSHNMTLTDAVTGTKTLAQLAAGTSVEDTATNGHDTVAISSNWAFDHAALSLGAHGIPADPGADRFLMWDDDPGALVWTAIAGGGDMLKATYDADEDGVIAIAQLDTDVAQVSEIDDVPVDGETAAPISSNWAFDHAAATTGVHGVGAGTVAKTADIAATKIDDLTAGDDNTDLNANTTNHGLLVKATAPAAGLYNYVGITNAETAYTNKALFDATAPTDSDAVSAGAVGTAAVAARRDHVHKLDAAIADDAVLTVDDAAAADDDFARFTANGIEGLATQAALTALLGAVLAENDAIQLDPALSADGKWNGITETGTAGAALAFGDICYLAVADSRWELAKADAAATSFGKLGICVLAAGADGNATTMLLWGKVRADAAFPAMTVGAPVFISAATAGDVTSTAPAGTTNFVVRIVGYGNTADELFFAPDATYLELA